MPVIDDYQELLDSPFADILVVHMAVRLQRPASLNVWLSLGSLRCSWYSLVIRCGATGRPVPLLMQFLANRVMAKVSFYLFETSEERQVVAVCAERFYWSTHRSGGTCAVTTNTWWKTLELWSDHAHGIDQADAAVCISAKQHRVGWHLILTIMHLNKWIPHYRNCWK